MGLLDDAIREHLELKRRHGADPTEVARQESEALGPVRRAAEAPAEAPLDPEAEADAVFAHEPEPEDLEEPAWPEPEPLEREPEPEPRPGARRMDPDMIDQPTAEHPAARPAPEDEDLFDFEPEPEPEREPEPRARPAAERDEDVLEGTPEFLEETPEHDRLWFEQRPPRDFDFDD